MNLEIAEETLHSPRLAAIRFLEMFRKDREVNVLASKLRLLAHESRSCVYARAVILEMYRALGDGHHLVARQEDMRVFVTAPAENLDLVPLIRDDVERVLSRNYKTEDPVWGLWNYLVDLFLRKLQASFILGERER